MKICAMHESIEVNVIDHTIQLNVYDETSEESQYTFVLEINGASLLANALCDAIEKVMPAYGIDPTPTLEQRLADLFGGVPEPVDDAPTRPFLHSFDTSDSEDNGGS